MEPKVVEPNRLKQIKYQFNHKDRFSNDHLVDIQASKVFFREFAIFDKPENEGYVKDISLDPFGYSLISEIQVLYFILLRLFLYLII